MSAAKKVVAKKPRAKRPPRSVWLHFSREGFVMDSFTTKRDADADAAFYGAGVVVVAGPYVLAERVRQR